MSRELNSRLDFISSCLSRSVILRRCERHARLLGILGAGLVFFGAIVSALSYSMERGELYPFHHWPVSGLGIVSPLSELFNASLMVGALLMAMFGIGISRHINTRAARQAALVGVIAAVALIVVAYLPSRGSDRIIHHGAAAVAFLCGGVLMVGFTLHLRLHAPVHFPAWLFYPSAGTTVLLMGLLAALGTFLYSFDMQLLYFQVGWLPGEPEVNGLVLLEWCAFVSLHAMVLLTALGFQSVPKTESAIAESVVETDTESAFSFPGESA